MQKDASCTQFHYYYGVILSSSSSKNSHAATSQQKSCSWETSHFPLDMGSTNDVIGCYQGTICDGIKRLNERSLALGREIMKILFSKRNKLLRTSLADKPKDKNIFLIDTREIKSWQSLIETKTSISLNKHSYEAFLSAAMIITYPNPLSFRLNNEAIIPKEYLSMTKYFEVGFSEKRNKL